MNRRNELTESDMEDAIVADPEKFLGELGLKLVARQYRVGSYIFDLLFEDRHGAKLIVEIQLGTLDRNHTYKILDYYEEYKDNRPKEFIEVMLVANRFTYERRRRLDNKGIPWREIPEENFLVTIRPLEEETKSEHVINIDEHTPYSYAKTHSAMKPKETTRLTEDYVFFQKQAELFFGSLKDIQPPVRITVHPDKSKNWFTCFAPISWGRKISRPSSKKGSGYGTGVLGYTFNYTKNNSGNRFVRLYIGVENPLKKEFRENFKKEISEVVVARNITLPIGCRTWPNTKFPYFRFHGTSLIECQPVALDDTSWERVCHDYIILNNEYNDLVEQTLRSYYNKDKDAFYVDIDFNI